MPGGKNHHSEMLPLMLFKSFPLFHFLVIATAINFCFVYFSLTINVSSNIANSYYSTNICMNSFKIF